MSDRPTALAGATHSDTMTSEIASSVRSVPAAEWNALVGPHPYAAHGWLRAAEEGRVHNLEPHYVLLRDGGRLVGAAPCYVARHGAPPFAPSHFLYGPARRITMRIGCPEPPALVCCPFLSYGGQLLVAPHLTPAVQTQTRRLLLDQVEALARAQRLALWVPRVLAADADTEQLLAEQGCHRTVQPPVAYLPIRWDSFRGYLESLRSMSRNSASTVRREINANRRAGVVIRSLDSPEVGTHARELQSLGERHHGRLNASPYPYREEFLPTARALLGDDLVVYGAFKAGALVGFSVLVRRGATGTVSLVGVDHDRTRNDFTYFNLTYYRPIEDAIASGIGQLYFGSAKYLLKMRRGCRITPVHFYYRGRTPLRHRALAPWFAWHARTTERRFARFNRVDCPETRASIST